MNWKIPLFNIYWDKSNVDAVAKVIKRGSSWAIGPEIDQLEGNIAKYVGMKYALGFNSGTSAIHAGLLAHGINSGEVIVPSFTFISTANAVILASAKPTFAEIEDETYGLDTEDVKEKINSKTKAIMPVHYGGAPCKNIEALREICDDYNLVLIEDAAESLGAKIKDRMVGTFGHSGIFSFCQNKIITAGEGGALVTNSKDVYQKLKLIRSHGRVDSKENYFSTTKEPDYTQVGYNYRISSICAALVLSQLKKIDKIIKMRREKADYYNKKLSKLKNIKVPLELKDNYYVYQLYTIQLENKQVRDKVQKNLEKNRIMSKVYFEPVHLKTFYKDKYGYREKDLPKTEEISKKVLTLPLYPTITKGEMDIVVDTIENCL